MTSIIDTLQQQLGPDTIEQLSRSIGADAGTTSNAVSLALPALLGGLSHNASNEQGAAALDRALGDHDGSILDNLGGLFGAGGGEGQGQGIGGGIGGAILGHIFGHKQSSVEEGVSRGSGLNAQQVIQLLTMLAPIVMGVLGRAKRNSGLDASRLPNVLQESAEKAQGGNGGLAGLFPNGGAGDILGSIFGKS
ncbi:MAG TPA: DUF937 domain-containing protein [Thermoanaerobaculia bacterium]|nr:DUF937 domain-containing protein [Thermoanaerobaculia bacterium]